MVCLQSILREADRRRKRALFSARPVLMAARQCWRTRLVIPTVGCRRLCRSSNTLFLIPPTSTMTILLLLPVPVLGSSLNLRTELRRKIRVEVFSTAGYSFMGVYSVKSGGGLERKD